MLSHPGLHVVVVQRTASDALPMVRSSMTASSSKVMSSRISKAAWPNASIRSERLPPRLGLALTRPSPRHVRSLAIAIALPTSNRADGEMRDIPLSTAALTRAEAQDAGPDCDGVVRPADERRLTAWPGTGRRGSVRAWFTYC